MGKVYKTFDIKVKERRADGGTITISTGGRDRDNDRVFPSGARIENYLQNPVVQFGHNYRDPWATVGRTESLKVGSDSIDADFELRPAANEMDPQNIVRLLWEGDWVRAASIGFQPDPEHVEENELGGLDFKQWELLEWSLVAIPANQEALARIAKDLGDESEGVATVKMPCKTCRQDFEISRTLAVYSLVGKQPVFCEHCGRVVSDLLAEHDKEPKQIQIVWTCGKGHEHETKSEAQECILNSDEPAPEVRSADDDEHEGEEPDESLSDAKVERDEPDSGQATRSDDATPVTDADDEPEIDEDAIAEALTPLVYELREELL